VLAPLRSAGRIDDAAVVAIGNSRCPPMNKVAQPVPACLHALIVTFNAFAPQKGAFCLRMSLTFFMFPITVIGNMKSFYKGLERLLLF
jgi:hypothetical protein